MGIVLYLNCRKHGGVMTPHSDEKVEGQTLQ